MPSTPYVRALGTAAIEAEPELAHIVAVVRAHAGSREAALDEVAERNRTCEMLVRGYGTAVDHSEAARPTVRVARHAGLYTGTVLLSITVADFAVLGELVARLAEPGHTEVRGPRWSLRPGGPALRRAMRAAAQDAIDHAGEYAAAFGCRITGLAEVTDVRVTATPRLRCLEMYEEEMLMSGALPPFDVTPERQSIQVRIDARFSATPPDGL